MKFLFFPSETCGETGKYTDNGDSTLADVRKSRCLLLRKEQCRNEVCTTKIMLGQKKMTN